MDRLTKAINMRKELPGAVIQGLTEEELADNLKDASGSENEGKVTRSHSVSPQVMRQNKIITEITDNAISDSYKLLRTRILRRMKENGWKTIGVTSADKGVGKTLTAVNLAITIAMDSNHSALLVDADLRKPSVQSMFGIESECGLTDYLNESKSVADLLISPGIEHFTILPSSSQLEGTSELLTTHKMAMLVDELRERYDDRIVIFDLPPILVGDDVLAFSSFLDSFLLVVEDGQTQSDDLVRAMELLEGCNMLGVVLNKAKDGVVDTNKYY